MPRGRPKKIKDIPNPHDTTHVPNVANIAKIKKNNSNIAVPSNITVPSDASLPLNTSNNSNTNNSTVTIEQPVKKTRGEILSALAAEKRKENLPKCDLCGATIESSSYKINLEYLISVASWNRNMPNKFSLCRSCAFKLSHVIEKWWFDCGGKEKFDALNNTQVLSNTSDTSDTSETSKYQIPQKY